MQNKLKFLNERLSLISIINNPEPDQQIVDIKK